MSDIKWPINSSNGMNKGLHNRSFGEYEDKALKQVVRIVSSGTFDIQSESYSPEINDKDFVF